MNAAESRLLDVVMVAYHRPNDLARCFDAILAQSIVPRAVVVANNDACRDVRRVCRNHPMDGVSEIIVIDLDGNWGPAGGFDVGIERVAELSGDNRWVLLQDDNDPIPHDILGTMFATADDLEAKGHVVGGIGLRGGSLNRRRALIEDGRTCSVSRAVLHVDHLHGGWCPVYRLDALVEAGGMRRELFFGFEELDLGLRIIDHDWQLYALRDDLRDGQRSSRCRPSIKLRDESWRRYFSLRNLILILRERRGAWLRVALVRALGKGVINAVVWGRWSSIGVGYRAVSDALTGRLGYLNGAAAGVPVGSQCRCELLKGRGEGSNSGTGREMSDTSEIFITGMGRAGTSLLRRMINATGQAQLLPETHLLDVWYPRIGDARLAGPDRRELIDAVRAHPHIRKLRLSSEWIQKVPDPAGLRDVMAALMAHNAGQLKRGGDKNPAQYRYVSQLLNWFPQSRVLFTVRDPRGYVASMRSLDLRWARGSTYQHVRRWKRVAACARRWCDHDRVLVVRYEELAAREESFVRRLEEFLALDLAATFRAGSTRVLPHGSLDPSDLAVSTARVSAWKDVLSADDVALIEYMAEEHMLYFGYSPSRDGRRPMLRWGAEFVGDIPRKLRAGYLRGRRTLDRHHYERRGVSP